MIKVQCTHDKYIGDGECKSCTFTLDKPMWEHVVNTIYKQGGHAGKNICPVCRNKSLKFDFNS